MRDAEEATRMDKVRALVIPLMLVIVAMTPTETTARESQS